MPLNKLLQQARGGGAVLFCGAGFTAECLGYEFDQTLGVSGELLRLLNEGIAVSGGNGNFKRLDTAARDYKTRCGEYGLMQLLQKKFEVQNVPQNLVDVLRLPWERVYTTNYDNGIELSLTHVPRNARVFNNADTVPDPLPAGAVIHLHGRAKSWTIQNFSDSCILDTQSYARLPSLGPWLQQLRYDLERATAVIFVGFSANDFHLNQVFFNASGLKPKSVFVNRPCAEVDPDAEVLQRDYGEPVYLGVSGLAAKVRQIMASQQPAPLRLSSFSHYEPERPSPSVPSVSAIQDLLTWGKFQRSALARDVSLEVSDYHVLRDAVSEIIARIDEGGRIFLINGEVCDGKTLVAEAVAQKLSQTRPIFWLKLAYDDLLDEVARIIQRHPDAMLVVENCFELRSERLAMLARTFEGGTGILLLTARSIAADAETGKVKVLKPLASFREIRLEKLNDREIEAIEALIDQFGGFAHLNLSSRQDRIRFIKNTCNRSLPATLLEVLRSPFVRQKYREALNRGGHGTPAKDSNAAAMTGYRRLLIASMFLKHIGDPPPASFLSDYLHIDPSRTISDEIARSGQGDIELLRIERGFVNTVPAIGASLILREFFADQDIVSVVIDVLEAMATQGRPRNEYARYAFSQMMRYSRLSTVVEDRGELDRFFDHISKIGFFREEPLFWLQWHMAKLAAGEFVEAERLLDRGFREAENWERQRGTPYNRRQLQDRKGKFIAARMKNQNRSSAEMLRDTREAFEILGRLLQDQEMTHHPFETLRDLLDALTERKPFLDSTNLSMICKWLSGVLDHAKMRLANVPEGYQEKAAVRAWQQIEVLGRQLGVVPP